METSDPDYNAWVSDLLQSLQEVLNLLSKAEITAREILGQDSNSELRNTLQKAEVQLLRAYSLAVKQVTTENEARIDSAKEEGESDK